MKRFYSITLIAIVLNILIGCNVFAEYTSSEILVIPWGEGPDELPIRDPYMEMIPDDYSDSLHEVWYPSGGPHQGFVDIEENFYFISMEMNYLKGFHNSGKSFVYFIADRSNYTSSVFKFSPYDLFVDSKGLIYTFYAHGYPTIFDGEGNFVGIFDPPGQEPENNIVISLEFYNFNEELVIHSNRGTFIYKDGEFTKGGYRDWKASDGYYYFGNCHDTSSFEFIKFKTYAQIDTFYVKVDRKLGVGALIGIDLNDNYYMRYSESKDDFPLDILVLDRNFKEKDHFRLFQKHDNKYLWNVHNATFLRGDGNVYQFLCEDDGMHIIRWRKE